MKIEKSDYMLLFRGDHWDQGISPEEVDQRLAVVMAWFERVKEQATVKGGQPLAPGGRTLSSKNGRITDGPFAESKEEVGGYLVIEANNIDEAIAVAKSCPTLAYGITIEVREVLEECPIFKRARERAAHATV